MVAVGVNGGGTMVVHNHIKVDVHGHVLAEHQLKDLIVDITQTHIHTNGRSDLTPKYGRG